ncbi:MAG: BatA domain-containing protein [Verrucomicrobia bacterium]|nr:BatA domain-containing protein [Verrucomicrobiota bacterium]
MLPLNPWMLLGLAGIAVPILIHLLTRQTGQTIDWGAMNFLRDSLVTRNRRIHLEDALLMAARCLLVGLLALALARPFIPPGSAVPWFLVLPMALGAIVAGAVAVVLWELRRWRWSLLAAAALLGGAAVSLVLFEKWFNLSRFSGGDRQDVVLILDASTSMALEIGGQSNFSRAVDEARDLVRRAPRGTNFSLILGGPTPSARVLAPTADRDLILRNLEDAKPLNGAMAAYDCFTLASLALAQGSQVAKQIVVLTDNQNIGWETGKAARWQFLRDAFDNLPANPKVVIREMPLPPGLRNLSIARIALSRDVVGVDRPVRVRVTVENTGSEAVSPRAVELQIGRKKLVDRTLGQILPGTEETVEFVHQFSTPGAQEIRARLDVEDEIIQDNEAVTAEAVIRKLRVLLVDGNPAGPFFERAASFASLALAPGALASGPEPEKMRFLVEPEVVPAQNLPVISFGEYDAIILADVPRLPQEKAVLLQTYVAGGGGVLIATGPKAQADFYNGWLTANGQPWLPGRLKEAKIPDGSKDPVTAALDTFRHPALRLVADRDQSDLPSLNFSHYWRLEPEETAGAVVGGRLNNGDPWVISRREGAGQIVQLASSLDLRSGNLPSREAFLPLLHELVYFLANPRRIELNLEPKWELALPLSGRGDAFAGNGVNGTYEHALSGSRLKPVNRLDPAIQFTWREGAPADGIPAEDFKVRWTGKIQPPRSGNYRFEADADDSLEVSVDGRNVLRSEEGRQRNREVWLEANRLHDFRADFRERTGRAMAVLYWSSDQLPRQIVPPSAFRSITTPKGGTPLATFQVEGPLGEIRKAQVTGSAEGAVAKIQGDVAAGLYRIRVPDADRLKVGELLAEDAKTIPFTVTRDPAESRLVPLSPADREFLGRYLGLLYPETVEEALQILTGKSFGEELWKPLAVGAFLFMLIESALARWIAASRRAGTGQKIHFESKGAVSESFRRQLAALRK